MFFLTLVVKAWNGDIGTVLVLFPNALGSLRSTDSPSKKKKNLFILIIFYFLLNKIFIKNNHINILFEDENIGFDGYIGI